MNVNGEMDEAAIIALAQQLVADFPPGQTSDEDFLGAQFDRGLAWVNHPVGEGGLGVDVQLQAAVNHVIAAAGGPDASAVNYIGHGMCAPTIVEWGTPEQRERYLRPLFTGAEVWCQLFSEPGAGSDVAALATRAVQTDDGWIVNGQKVWTTMAHRARWGLLIARTDPAVAKHAGMTAFLLDMQSPGVDVRPLYQITAEAEFNEVFMDDVKVPADAILGTVGGGWGVVLTTLMNERVSIGGGIPPMGDGPIRHLVDAYAQVHERDPNTSALYRDQVIALWIRAETIRLTNIRMSQLRKPGVPGPEGSIGKILSADFNKAVYSELMNLLGGDGLLFGAYEKVRPRHAVEDYSTPQKAFLRSRANSIEGGTGEIMRNILAERMLGLPGDPRADKNLAWNEIPRS